MQKQSIKELTGLGLSENETKTYLALLVKGVMSVGEITSISRVPRPKLYGIIKGLVEKGLCVEKPGNVKAFSAVSPRIVSNRLLQNYQNELENKKELANRFVENYSTIYDQGRNKEDSLDYIEILKDQRIIVEKVKSYTKKLKSEVLSLTKAPYAFPLESGNPLGVKALKRGVTSKCIYEKHESLDKKYLEHIIMPFADAGEEIRIVENLPMKLHIFDREIIVITLTDTIYLKQSYTRLIITHKEFAALMIHAFFSIWNESQPFEDFLKEYNKNK